MNTRGSKKAVFESNGYCRGGGEPARLTVGYVVSSLLFVAMTLIIAGAVVYQIALNQA